MLLNYFTKDQQTISARGAAGVFFGSPMSGVTVSQRNLRASLGIEKKSIAVDGLWSMGEWLDDEYYKWGPRAGLGIAVPMGQRSYLVLCLETLLQF